MSDSSTAPLAFDPDRELLAGTYAEALLGATEKAGVTPRVMEELKSLVEDVLDRLPGFERLLTAPRMRVEEKLRVLDAVFVPRMDPLLLNFLKVVARHGRLDCLRQIQAAAHTKHNHLQRRVDVIVETADAVSGPLRSELQQQLTGMLGLQVEIHWRVNADLLGGLIVRVGDTVYDGSLERGLQTMRRDVLNQAAQVIRDTLPRFVVSQAQ
jgi:F-type H+-transporting ATPase subunit delta